MLSNYNSLTKIYESANSLIYRGLQAEDNKPIILKVLKEDYPTPEELKRYRQEYDITRQLKDIDGVINVYDLKKNQNTLFMCLEDFEAESLKNIKISDSEILQIAIQITEILAQIHQHNIIHKDINPANIVYNSAAKILKIIDFGISTQLFRQHLSLKNPEVLEGTLAYMSPEQTGRMNRALDYRSDFYSLGATFYELFTGQLPFNASDAMELVHCHLAKPPPLPHEVNSDVPIMISKIIMKLMAKTAEERYQSAWGIKADLEQCLINTHEFPLARFDISERLQIPQKLYGRERDIETLLTSFEQVSQGDKQLMLVSGYSGIGKSVLVKEIYKSLTEKQGYFISGKFDQFQINIPYKAVVEAFRELVKILLTESDSKLEQWKQKLLTALHPNAQVIIDVIPEIEKIIGPQPEVPILGGIESQNRFNFVFQNFIRVFCQVQHPLVIFLDDLQWVDSATLKLLELVMTDKDTNALFLIGAYRDNEVSPTHSLITTIDQLTKANIVIKKLVLKNLNIAALSQLVADTLHKTPSEVKSLTDLIIRKTEGNPFFVGEFLKTLYEENLLNFTPTNGWQWDIAHIEAKNITDNVVDLMISKLKKLPQSSQSLLRLAACVGNSFDLNTLSIISEKQNCLQKLLPVIKEGLVFKSDEFTFNFAHDRVQQAAYALIDDNQKQSVHLTIGRLLLKTNEAYEKHIFDLVEHFNISLALINSSAEKHAIAQLNLIAGNKANLSTAYSAAVKYFHYGLECVANNGWKNQYDLTLALYIGAAEAAYLNGDFEQMEQFVQIVQTQAKTVLDVVKVYEIKLQALTGQNKLLEVLTTGLYILKQLGINFPKSPNNLDILFHLLQTKITLFGKQIETLNQLPAKNDPYKLAILRIISHIASAAYLEVPNLMVILLLKGAYLAVKLGNTKEVVYFYSAYGFLICYLGKIEAGYKFGKLSMQMLEDLNAKQLKPKSMMVFHGFVNVWKNHIKDNLNPFLEGYQSALEIGDLEYAAHHANFYSFFIFYIGTDLTKVKQEMAKYESMMVKLEQKSILTRQHLYLQIISNLQGKNDNPCLLNGEYLEEAKMFSDSLEKNYVDWYLFYLHKVMLAYLFEEYSLAISNSIETEKFLENAAGLYMSSLYYFYDSLTRLALYSTLTSTSEQKKFLKKIAKNQKQIKKWADHAPMNYLHKYYLVEAERARLLNNEGEARIFYDKAISLSQQNEYLTEEALAHELAAKFYLSKNLTNIAKTYLRDAHYCYRKWGAIAKVTHLTEQYPQLLENTKKLKSNATISLMNSITSQRNISTLLDLSSVIKASQTISEEIVLSKLLEKMMQIVIENAGADTGFLLLPQQDKWFIQASETSVLQSISIEDSKLPLDLINYVIRTQEHIVKQAPKSILCLPLLNQNKLTGILYLENQLIEGAFTDERLAVLNLLTSQLAISIENSLLYDNLEQKVADRTIELKKANEAKSEFLSSMSHELRTPLNGILGYAQILKRAKNLEETQISGLNTIYNSGNHLLTLINDILDLSKIEARKLELYPETIHFANFIDSITGIMRMRAEQKDVYFTYETVGNLPLAIEADEKRLRQVLINLLGNAIKFTDKGQVTLRVSEIEEGIFRFEVEDTGVGMSEQELQKIFTPFEQVGNVNKRAEGTGLGLAISRQLIELMGSQIQVKSELGKGSSFWFDMPVKIVEMQSQQQQQQHRIIGYKDQTQIALIVDDYSDNRLILRQMLEEIGFRVIEANDGKQGVAKTIELEPNIIFMDLVMPIMNGFEAVETIRQNFKQLPIIAISANVFETDKNKSLQVGCNAFLAKPIEEQKLFNILVEHLDLDWKYEDNKSEATIEQTEAELIPPTSKELEKLYELAMMGDMREIKEYAMQLDKKYIVFANKIVELAKGFEDEQILSLIEEFI
jgi:predicted ATPase/signal transduction histidine kinase/CheY-like chemotaxis protein/tRNA A-37 threonylcarbamoyl transferase component Bud32